MAPIKLWAFPQVEFDDSVFDSQVEVFQNDFFTEGVLGEEFFEKVAEQRRRETPNYNFALETLDPFRPGASWQELLATHGTGEVIKRRDELRVHRYYVAHIRYKFPVFVTIENDEITKMKARLPNYFLHDIFHQSLINRFGPQDEYFKKEEQAIYQWQEQELTHTYMGSCTITCFPVFYTVQAR